MKSISLFSRKGEKKMEEGEVTIKPIATRNTQALETCERKGGGKSDSVRECLVCTIEWVGVGFVLHPQHTLTAVV